MVMQEVRESMGEVEQLYQQCADLSEVVKPIKEVNRKHQQVCVCVCVVCVCGGGGCACVCVCFYNSLCL